MVTAYRHMHASSLKLLLTYLSIQNASPHHNTPPGHTCASWWMDCCCSQMEPHTASKWHLKDLWGIKCESLAKSRFVLEPVRRSVRVKIAQLYQFESHISIHHFPQSPLYYRKIQGSNFKSFCVSCSHSWSWFYKYNNIMTFSSSATKKTKR